MDGCSPGREFRLSPTAVFLPGAAAAAVFFQGFEAGIFFAAQSLLVLWLLWALWSGYRPGFNIPRTATALVFALLWGWLALSLLWTRVFSVSVLNFWLVGAAPLAFWTCILASDGDSSWPAVERGVLFLGLALAAVGLYQFFALGLVPSAAFHSRNSYAGLLALIAIPTAAGCLLAGNGGRRSGEEKFLAAAFFILVFAVAMTRGRGATVSLIAGLALLAGTVRRIVPRRPLVTLIALTALAYLLTALLWWDDDVLRLADVTGPMDASSMAHRLEIWKGTWRMIADEPWRGVGLGLFASVYPAYRLPGEASAGFHPHNDYLEFWVEAGIPALFLILALGAAVGALSVRARRAPATGGSVRIEIAGLTAALAATALHSAVDFNLHILSILILAGAILARVHRLAAGPLAAPAWHLVPARRVSPWGYRVVIVLGLALPLAHFGAVAFSARETERGVDLAAEGRLDEADRALARAQRFHPAADEALVSRADLYRHVLALNAGTGANERAALFVRARAFLDNAEELNPLRPLTHLVRGRLYEENPELAGPEADKRIEAAYGRALEINPRFFPAREAYARRLYERGRVPEARRIVEGGLREVYPLHISIVPFFTLAEKLRREAGDEAGAAELRERIAEAARSTGERIAPVPESVSSFGPAVRPGRTP